MHDRTARGTDREAAVGHRLQQVLHRYAPLIHACGQNPGRIGRPHRLHDHLPVLARDRDHVIPCERRTVAELLVAVGRQCPFETCGEVAHVQIMGARERGPFPIR